MNRLHALNLVFLLACSVGCGRSEEADGSKTAAPAPAPRASVDAAAGARAVALARFNLAPGDAASLKVATLGKGNVAVAKDARTGVCLVLYQEGGDWKVHRMVKGDAGDPDVLIPPPLQDGSYGAEFAKGELLDVLQSSCK